MKSLRTKTAEANFRDAFDRLKCGVPNVLAKGTFVSQNNVAKEAGRDPSALRKARFSSLVAEIQNYVNANAEERPPSERQKLLKQRQRHRSTRDTIRDVKSQRDIAASLLIEANAQILRLTQKLASVEARMNDLQSMVKSFPVGTIKPKSVPRAPDDHR